MKLLATFLLVTLPAFSPFVHAFAGSTGAAFLELPFDPRASALGGANTALTADGFSARWNPAGLAFLEEPALAASQLAYLEDTSNSFLGYAQPFSQAQGFGLALQYFRPGSLIERDATDQAIGTFNGYSMAGTLAYGRQLDSHFAIGVSLQRLTAKIADVTASAWSAGWGMQWRPLNTLSLGFAMENLGTDMRFIHQSDPLPITARLGSSYLWRRQMTIALEGAYKRGAGVSGHLGIEWPNEEEKGYAFRTGFDSDYRNHVSGLAGFSAGVAVRILGQDVAYAWIPLSDIGMAHLFTIQFHWGQSHAQPHADMTYPEREEPSLMEDFSN